MEYLSNEVLTLILLEIDDNGDLSQCRRVCSLWRRILDSKHYWRMKMRNRFNPEYLDLNIPWFYYKHLSRKNPFYKNILLNGDCDMDLIDDERKNIFPHWFHIGDYYKNWTREIIPSHNNVPNIRTCFNIPLTDGPNTIFQKIM